jgi:polyhydroxybutyrate depolymerase
MECLGRILFAGGLAVTACCAQVEIAVPRVEVPANEDPGVKGVMDRMVAALGAEGAGITILVGDRVAHRSVHGVFTGDRVIPIASASKWLAVATILTLVDDGTLDLDVPVGRYLPEFDVADKRAVTLRQCLSCTAGFPARVPELRRSATMKDLAEAIADLPLRASPGVEFVYGGTTFQVAACAAERVTGVIWHELFRARIAEPLRMASTRFGRLVPIAAEAGTAAIPWVAGGAESTMDDYRNFVVMLLQKGEFEGRRVLQAASVAAMFADVAADIVVRDELVDGMQARYGLGTWLLRADDRDPLSCADPGAFGFTPWIDPELGIGGVLAVRHRFRQVLPWWRELRGAARGAVRSAAVAGIDTEVTLGHGGRDRRYLLHVPARESTAAALPLLVVLHGGGGNAAQARATMGFDAVADREGFAVVWADGTGPLRGRLLTWNSGGIPVYAQDQRVDDVGFLKAVVADVCKRVVIDPDRVYATGHSNGGMMCHRLAREAADVFAAIAPVAGAMNFTGADPVMPISVLMIHGSDDEHVLYDGGRPKRQTGRAGDRVDGSVRAAAEYYVARAGLRQEPMVEQDGKVETTTWDWTAGGSESAVRVRVVRLIGGGHAWPGAAARQTPLSDLPFDYPAARAIWDFVKTARRQTAAAGAPR